MSDEKSDSERSVTDEEAISTAASQQSSATEQYSTTQSDSSAAFTNVSDVDSSSDLLLSSSYDQESQLSGISSSDDGSFDHHHGGLVRSSSRVIAVGMLSSLVEEEQVDAGIPMIQNTVFETFARSYNDAEGGDDCDPKSSIPSDVHQARISRVVAMSIAEREHNEKMEIIKPPPPPLAVTITPHESTFEFGRDQDADEPPSATEGSLIMDSDDDDEMRHDHLDQDDAVDDPDLLAGIAMYSDVPGAFAVGPDDEDEDVWSHVVDPSTGVVPQIVDLTHQETFAGFHSQGEGEQPAPMGELVDAAVVPEEEETPKRNLWQRITIVGIGLIAVVVVVVVATTTGLGGSSSSTADVESLIGWKAVGSALIDPSRDDDFQFGHVVSFGANGNRVAVGVPAWYEGANRLQIGKVLVMDWDGAEWSVAAEMKGPSVGSRAGSSISMTPDGTMVAVGAPGWENRGQVAVYSFQENGDSISSEWTVVGSLLEATISSEAEFGSAVSLSANATTIAIGSPRLDGISGVDSGAVRVFNFVNGSWTQLGGIIEGIAAFSLFGSSIAVSANGERLIVGAIGSNELSGGGTADFTGQVKVYDLQGLEWIQVGQPIYGRAPGDRFGHSVSMNADGSVVAIGVNSQGSLGYVQVYQFARDSSEWVMLGETLMGDSSFDSFGYSVALSAGGKQLAVGSPFKTNNDVASGQVTVFEYSAVAGSWNQLQGSLNGAEQGDRFGWDVALSPDAHRVACSAPLSDFDSRVFNVGSVSVYEISSKAG